MFDPNIDYDEPSSIEFKNTKFFLTGAFSLGPRDYFAKWIEQEGGTAISSSKHYPLQQEGTQYVVVGEKYGPTAARDTKESKHRNKIDVARELKRKGYDCFIITETYCKKFLSTPQPELSEKINRPKRK